MKSEYIILLDTNFCLIPAQFNVDIFTEIDRLSDFPYKVAILDRTLGELDKIIEEQRGKHKTAARLAQALIKAKDLKIIPTPSSQTDVDSVIVQYAREHPEIIVATQDKQLKERLHSIDIRVITLRNKSHLVCE